MTADGQPGYKKAGADTVYPFKGWYALGSGTSFNIKTLCPGIDYATLTANDFIIEPVSGSAHNSDRYDNCSVAGMDCFLNKTKTYNNASGVLTAHYTVSGNYNIVNSGTRGNAAKTLTVTAYLVIS